MHSIHTPMKRWVLVALVSSLSTAAHADTYRVSQSNTNQNTSASIQIESPFSATDSDTNATLTYPTDNFSIGYQSSGDPSYAMKYWDMLTLSAPASSGQTTLSYTIKAPSDGGPTAYTTRPTINMGGDGTILNLNLGDNSVQGPGNDVSVTLEGFMSGAGTVNINNENPASAATVIFNNITAANFTGNMNLGTNTNVTYKTPQFGYNGSSYSGVNLSLGNSSTFNLYPQSYTSTINSLSGSGNLLINATGNNPATVNIIGSGSGYSGSMTISPSATVTYSGNTALGGSITINSGGSMNIHTTSGGSNIGTLSGSGTLNVAANTTISNGSSYSGTLNITGGTTTASQGMTIGTLSGSTGTTLSLGGNSTISNASSYSGV